MKIEKLDRDRTMGNYKVTLEWERIISAVDEDEAKEQAERALQDDINNGDIILDFDVEHRK